MLIELLDPPLDAEAANMAQHDLETLFYMFVWICLLYAAPRIIRDLDKSSASNSIIILKWNELKDSREVREIKKSHLSYRGNKVTVCFTPYFTSFRGCCVQLLDVIFLKSSKAHADYHVSLSPVTQNQIIAIFKRALELVLKEGRAKGVKTISSGTMNALIYLPNLTKPKQWLDKIADLQKYSVHTSQCIPLSIIHAMPIHMGDLPRSIMPLCKCVQLGIIPVSMSCVLICSLYY